MVHVELKTSTLIKLKDLKAELYDELTSDYGLHVGSVFKPEMSYDLVIKHLIKEYRKDHPLQRHRCNY